MKTLFAAAGLAGALLIASTASALPIIGDMGAHIDDREAHIASQIDNNEHMHMMPPFKANRARQDLRGIRDDENRWRIRDGGHLSDRARDELNRRLDVLEHYVREQSHM